jgi:cyclopropane-fatty-acyl-phospholipid synthase
MNKKKSSTLVDRFVRLMEKNIIKTVQMPFTVELWDGNSYYFGEGKKCFKVIVRNRAALIALSSLNELYIGEAYMNGFIDFEGDMLSLIAMRGMLTDVHPMLRLWRMLVPLFTSTLKRNRKGIATHYDYDSDFYLSFMDKSRCYSQAVFSSDTESLEIAQKRKFEFVIESCRVKRGDRLLDIGGGWGSLTEFAGKKGIEVTSLTISEESEKFISNIIKEKKLPCRVLNTDFLAYQEDTQYDAIAILGVMEHLPDYAKVIQQINRVLKPGGRVYMDASATDRKFDISIFVTRHIFPGGHTFFCLHEFLAVVAAENFEVITVHNDRKNYMLTCKAWAEKLDKGHEETVRRFGEYLYRMFRIYLWSSVYGFQSKGLNAYRVVLEKYNENL